MKKDLKKKYLIPAAVCLIILCGIGYSYFFSSFSKEDKTVYLYLDQDDTYDSLVVKVQPIAKRQSFHALCTLAVTATSLSTSVPDAMRSRLQWVHSRYGAI